MMPFVRTVTCLFLVSGLVACGDETNRVISQHTSPEGHVFHLMPITERGVSDITVSAAWKTDWLNDRGHNPLVPHLATQLMMSGGTEALAPAEVLDLLEGKNSYGNVSAAADLIYAEVEFPNNHADTVVPVLADMFQRPVFDPAWFERIKGQHRDIASANSTPLAAELWEASRYAILGNTAQTAFLNGNDLDRLDAATVAVVRDWHQNNFAHEPAALVVTGAVDAEGAGEIIDTLLPEPNGAAPVSFAAPELQLPDRMVFLHKPDAEKSVIGFIGTLPDTRDGLDGVDLAIAHLFAGGADSPLFDAIRRDLGASYGMSVNVVNYSRAQRGFVIAGEIDTAKMPQARDAVLAAYDAFRSNPDLDNLPEITQRIADSIRQESVYVSSSAAMIRELVLDGRAVENYHSLPDDIANMSPEIVQQRLREAFPDSGSLAIFAAGPDAAAFPDACVITDAVQALRCR